MVCRNCGHECGEAKFCSNCGTDMSVQRQEQYNSTQNNGYWQTHNNENGQSNANNCQYKQNYYENNGSYDTKNTKSPNSNSQGYWQSTPDQGSYQPPYHQSGYRPPYVRPDQPGKGMATASLVLGILSLVMLDMSIVFGILAIVFGAIARGQGYKGGMSVAGISCGIVSLVIYVCTVLLVLYGFMLL